MTDRATRDFRVSVTLRVPPFPPGADPTGLLVALMDNPWVRGPHSVDLTAHEAGEVTARFVVAGSDHIDAVCCGSAALRGALVRADLPGLSVDPLLRAYLVRAEAAYADRLDAVAALVEAP